MTPEQRQYIESYLFQQTHTTAPETPQSTSSPVRNENANILHNSNLPWDQLLPYAHQHIMVWRQKRDTQDSHPESAHSYITAFLLYNLYGLPVDEVTELTQLRRRTARNYANIVSNLIDIIQFDLNKDSPSQHLFLKREANSRQLRHYRQALDIRQQYLNHVFKARKLEDLEHEDLLETGISPFRQGLYIALLLGHPVETHLQSINFHLTSNDKFHLHQTRFEIHNPNANRKSYSIRLAQRIAAHQIINSKKLWHHLGLVIAEAKNTERGGKVVNSFGLLSHLDESAVKQVLAEFAKGNDITDIAKNTVHPNVEELYKASTVVDMMIQMFLRIDWIASEASLADISQSPVVTRQTIRDLLANTSTYSPLSQLGS
jgi:hypothetical protein